MSMTKRYIEELYDKAALGDHDAIDALSSAGLYETEEEHWERAAAESANEDEVTEGGDGIS